MYAYVSKETGEIVPYDVMMEMYRDDYDGGDDTNPLGWSEYFEQIPVPPGFWD